MYPCTCPVLASAWFSSPRVTASGGLAWPLVLQFHNGFTCPCATLHPSPLAFTLSDKSWRGQPPATSHPKITHHLSLPLLSEHNVKWVLSFIIPKFLNIFFSLLFYRFQATGLLWVLSLQNALLDSFFASLFAVTLSPKSASHPVLGLPTPTSPGPRPSPFSRTFSRLGLSPLL